MNKYDTRAKEIGLRIRHERERLKLSQQSMLSKIFKSESSGKTLRAWENGERLPDLDSLVRMADLFDCDVGYLLCDYNERTRDCADICRLTGLSGSAAETLIGMKLYDNSDNIQVLNLALENENKWRMYKALSETSAYTEYIYPNLKSSIDQGDGINLINALKEYFASFEYEDAYLVNVCKESNYPLERVEISGDNLIVPGAALHQRIALDAVIEAVKSLSELLTPHKPHTDTEQ